MLCGVPTIKYLIGQMHAMSTRGSGHRVLAELRKRYGGVDKCLGMKAGDYRYEY